MGHLLHTAIKHITRYPKSNSTNSVCKTEQLIKIFDNNRQSRAMPEELVQLKKKQNINAINSQQQHISTRAKLVPVELLVPENNDNCSAVVFTEPLTNSFLYKTAAYCIDR